MRKYLNFIGLCLIAGLILFWFGRNLNWAEVSGAIGHADWRLIAAAIIFVWATYLIRAFRWRVLLAPLAPKASLSGTFAATSVGFAAIFVVGRAVGEVLRPAFLSIHDREVRPGAAFVTIAVERIFDTAAVIVLFAANMLFLHLPGVSEEATARIRTAGLVLLGGITVGVVALVLFRRHAGSVTLWLGAKLERWPGAIRRAGKIAVGLLEQTARTLDILASARSLLIVVGWTAALWGAITLANMLVLRAFGLPLGMGETVFVLGWSLVGSLVPTPGGGAGTYHAATAYSLMTYFGVAETEAKAAVIVLNLVVFGTGLPFGIYYFLRSGVSLSRLRELIAAETAESEASAVNAQAGESVAGGAPRTVNV